MNRTYQMLINGEWVDSSNSRAFDSINPSPGEVWTTMPEATEEDVDKAVRAARAAFAGWAAQTPTARGHALRKLAGLLEEQSESLGRTESLDTGKLYRETRWQAKYIAEFFYFVASRRRGGGGIFQGHLGGLNNLLAALANDSIRLFNVLSRLFNDSIRLPNVLLRRPNGVYPVFWAFAAAKGGFEGEKWAVEGAGNGAGFLHQFGLIRNAAL